MVSYYKYFEVQDSPSQHLGSYYLKIITRNNNSTQYVPNNIRWILQTRSWVLLEYGLYLINTNTLS